MQSDRLGVLQWWQSWDRARTARMGTTGLLVTGPLAHGLFGALERAAPGTSALLGLARVHEPINGIMLVSSYPRC